MTSKNGREGIDPVAHCITIVSVCNLVFRKLFVERKSIGIIAPQGYRPKEKQSIKAMQWIKYHPHQTNVEIQHAGNVGEKVIGWYKTDGCYKVWNKKVVIEFHGDYWHVNPKCYSAKSLNKVTQNIFIPKVKALCRENHQEIKTKMNRCMTFKQSKRYIDRLQEFAQSYNKTYRRTIDTKPELV